MSGTTTTMTTSNNRTVLEDTGASRMTPEEILTYVAKLGEQIAQNANTVRAMLACAEDRGIPVDLTGNTTLGSFEARGHREIDLVTIRAELLQIASDLHIQGVLMTASQRDEYVAKLFSEE